jgi:hypothetical protein
VMMVEWDEVLYYHGKMVEWILAWDDGRVYRGALLVLMMVGCSTIAWDADRVG